MEQKFEIGKFKVTEEEKATMSPEELKKLEEKIERMNLERLERMRELYLKQLEEGLSEALNTGFITKDDVGEWLKAVERQAMVGKGGPIQEKE